MSNIKLVSRTTFLLGLVSIACGCIVTPRDGYYDHDHHRYYREHRWHECMERDEHCRRDD